MTPELQIRSFFDEATKTVTYRRDAQTLHYRICDARAERILAVLRDIFCPELGE